MFSTVRHKLHSTGMPAPLTIARRFRGPAHVGERRLRGGPARAGSSMRRPVEVTLRLPPPLERPLARRPRRRAHAAARRRRARGRGARRRSRPRAAAAADVRRGGGRCPRVPAAGAHPAFDECFVCGHPAGGRRPRASTQASCPAARTGSSRRPGSRTEVRPEIVWAAIDCPGAYALSGERRAASRCSRG